MKTVSAALSPLDVRVVGFSTFGQTPKISAEKTINMYVTDGFLVSWPGYKKKTNTSNFQGRGQLVSDRYNHIIQVVDNNVIALASNLNSHKIGIIDTFIGDVTLAENDVGQIAICDKSSIWIFNYLNETFAEASLDFLPGYVMCQNNTFFAPDLTLGTWRLSAVGNGLSWPNDSQHEGLFQTKGGDMPIAIVQIPGLGNTLLIIGKKSCELWIANPNAQLFPYQKNTTFNIDYGCINPATIAFSDRFVIWLGLNEKAGPKIMFTNGGPIQAISTDGINYLLEQLTAPQDSYGLMFEISGHLIYQLTFTTDNLTLAYDFKEGGFYNLTDPYLNHHIAKNIVFFNNAYYFLGFDGGDTYQFGSQFTTDDGNQIPQIRLSQNMRDKDSLPFIANSLVLTIDQGNAAEEQRVDLSLSRDGGVTFSSDIGNVLNPLGVRKNVCEWWDLGQANDLVARFRFNGNDRFVVGDAIIRIQR